MPPRRGASRLEQAAAALTLVTAGRFAPRAAFRPFLTAYSAAKMHGDSFNTDTITDAGHQCHPGHRGFAYVSG